MVCGREKLTDLNLAHMRLISFFFLLNILLLSSCGKDNNPVPDVQVNFKASLAAELPRLTQPGGVELVDKIAGGANGVAGLVLYNKNGVYLAFDRCSTVNPEKLCAVTWQEGWGALVKDPCSGAYFDLSVGAAASSAPAEKSLRQYTVIVEGNYIRVVN